MRPKHYELLLACCQSEPDQEKIRVLISEIKEWEGFVSRAFAHAVIPIIYPLLKVNDLPIEIITELKTAYREIVTRSMFMSAELLKIVLLLKQNNIDVLVFKGPALSQLLYGDVSSRHYIDLDVLIEEEDLYEAIVVLNKEGFKLPFSKHFLKNKTYLRVGKDVPLDHQESALHVEIHWKLFERKFLIKKSDLFFSLQDVTINSTNLKTLNNEALLLYLCIHGSKHHWERLEWVMDVDRLIRQNSTVDWKRLLEEAKIMHSKRLFLLGLTVVYEFFQTPLPQEIVNEINREKELLIVRKETIENFYSDGIFSDTKTPVNLKSIANLSRLTDSKFNYIRSRFRSYFQLKEGDVLMVNLPSCLGMFYYIMRPLRLVRKYFSYWQS